jgi:hypothetical protein
LRAIRATEFAVPEPLLTGPRPRRAR